MKTNVVALLLAGALGAHAAPSAGCGKAPGLETGVQTVNVNGQDRQFIVRVPEGYDSDNPYRLILGIHWWGGTMDDVAYGLTVERGYNFYGLESRAEETAVFVAPNGIDGNWYNENGADYAFLDEMNRVVEESLCVDTDLRFTIGFSWGGSMSIEMACRGGDYPIRAATAIGAAGPFQCTPGTEPIGYLGIHGISDTPDRGRAMRDTFIGNNGCTGEEKPQATSGSNHVRSDYQCSGPPVTWVTFDGGHISAPHDGGQGDSAQSFVPDLAWELFSSF